MACASTEEVDSSMRIEQQQLGGFNHDRRELVERATSLRPDEVTHTLRR